MLRERHEVRQAAAELDHTARVLVLRLELRQDLGRPKVPDADAAVLTGRGKAHAGGVPSAAHPAVRGLGECPYPLVPRVLHGAVEVGLVAVPHGHQKFAVRAKARVVDRYGEGEGHNDGHGRQAEDLDRLVVVAQEQPELPRAVLPDVQRVVHVPAHVVLADGPLGEREDVQLTLRAPRGQKSVRDRHGRGLVVQLLYQLRRLGPSRVQHDFLTVHAVHL
mmetsp:Transcript_2264/g.7590  ORF Transcript_2264/g.7590 Transcript_2264/m.7590 type:complete len:220 (+) Transcript_2264:1419-2078(+)